MAHRESGFQAYSCINRSAIDTNAKEPSPTYVRTPEGVDRALRGEELRADIAHRFGSDVALMQLNHGIFDAASISVITLATMLGVEGGAGTQHDVRRFQPNIVLETYESQFRFARTTGLAEHWFLANTSLIRSHRRQCVMSDA